MSVKNRLKEFIKNEGITIAEFEKSINAANGYVNSISKGIGKDKMLLILEKYPNIDPQWLIYGKEPLTIKGDRNITNTGYIGGKIISESNIGNKETKELEAEVERLKSLLIEKEAQLSIKDELLKAKDDIIQLLRSQSVKSE